MEWIDLTYTIDEGCMTCGTPWHVRPYVKRLGTIKDVGRNTSVIQLGSHTATHLDSPLHFFDGTYSVDEIPLQGGGSQLQRGWQRGHNGGSARHYTFTENAL